MVVLEQWKNFMVPARDNTNVRHRRVDQGHTAISKLNEICTRRRVAVQAGANWGYWPIRFTEIFDTVYTFEPDPVCFSALVLNTVDYPNVVRFQAALGNERKLVDLWRDTDTTGNQKIAGPGIYPTLRIDDLGLEVCDLIYLDVEGQESEAIKGGLETIKRCRPIVVYEERQAFNDNTKAAAEVMDVLGYKHINAIGADIVMGPE